MFAPLKPASVFDMTNAENDIPGTLVVISKVGLPGIQLTRLNLARSAQWRAGLLPIKGSFTMDAVCCGSVWRHNSLHNGLNCKRTLTL